MWTEAAKKIRESSPQSSIYVGCDSIRYKRDGKYFAKYSTVVILHMDSKNGCKLFYDTQVLPDYGGIKQRLLTEVSFAVAAAMEIVDAVGERHMEVHLDINPNPKHKSSVAVKEAIGYVTGMGFEAKVKPEGFAATCAADHQVRH